MPNSVFNQGMKWAVGAEETHVPCSLALTTTSKLDCSCFTDAKTEAQRYYFAPGSAIGKW